MLGLPEYGEQQIAIMMGGPERAEFFAQRRAIARQTNRRGHRRTEPGAAHSGRPGQRRCHRAGLSAIRQARVLRRGWGRRLVVPAPGAGVPVHQNALSRQPASGAPSGRRWAALPFAGLKVLDLSTFWAGAYLTCYLGAFGADIVKVESIQRPDGFRYSGAFPFEGDDWYERSALWQATNLNKRDLTLDLTSRARPRHRSPAGRAGRRRRGELLAAGGGAVRPGLRIAGGAQARRDHGPDAGFRPARPLARLRRLGVEHRADRRGCRRSPATPTGRRATRRDPPIPSSVCTPVSRCWPRSSTGAAPARAN